MMVNPLANIFGNTNINFSSAPIPSINKTAEEKKEVEQAPVVQQPEEQKEASDAVHVEVDIKTDEVENTQSINNKPAEAEKEESAQEKAVDKEEDTVNDSEDSSDDDNSDDDQKEEEPKKKRRRRRTKAEMAEAKKAEESSSVSTEGKVEVQQEQQSENKTVEKANDTPQAKQEETANKSVGSNYKKVSTEVIKKYLTPNIEDPEWDEQVEYIEKELAKLKKFDSEINEGSIRIMVPLYANLGLYVAPMRSEYKAMLAILEDKDSGLISYQKAVNAVGANEAARRTNAFNACGNYKAEGMKNSIDLIDYTHLVRYRYEYLDGVMQQIEIAKSALISFLTVISKIEK